MKHDHALDSPHGHYKAAEHIKTVTHEQQRNISIRTFWVKLKCKYKFEELIESNQENLPSGWIAN